MKLRCLQQTLETLYQIETNLNIDDFLLDKTSLEELGKDTEAVEKRGEVLFLIEEEGEVSIGLYLRSDLPKTLEDGFLSSRYFATLEGVSHFVYLAYHAKKDRSVRKLELELQAEVDKFVTGILGVGFLQKTSPAQVRKKLFDEFSLISELDEEEKERYQTASKLAQRYSVYLERRFLKKPQKTSPLVKELRMFYRLALPEKITRILGV